MMRIIVFMLSILISVNCFAETKHYFAQVDKNNVVQRVIVADQEFINSGVVGDPSTWIETFDGQVKPRANIGDTYNKGLTCFVRPKPFASWNFNQSTYKWEAPISKPDDKQRYRWNEQELAWDFVEIK